MKSKYILAIDQGTTSSRCIIFNDKLEIISEARQEIKQYYPFPGAVEHDPEEIWLSVLNTMNSALHSAQLSKQDITSIGITNQRETCLLWNRKTGKPYHNAIVWQSRQSEPICKAWKDAGFEDLVNRKTGLVIDAYFSASKIVWLKEHVDELKHKPNFEDVCFGTIDTWLLWKLTEGQTHATDISNASRTMLCNIENGSWDDELLKLFKIPDEILPEIKPNAGFFGMSKIEGYEEIPITGMAGDQQAALFGQCCFDKGMAKNTYGTGCFMLMNTGKSRVNSQKGLLSTIAWKINDDIIYALEGSVFIAGSAIQWLRDKLQLIENSADSEKLAKSLESNEGVYFVPAFVGLGTPYWRSDVRGTITGLTSATGKAHIVRAALEAMAYQTYEVFDLMQKESGIKLMKLRIDGGAAANDFLAQFQADILRCEVERAFMKESTALGAAMLAGLGTGVWSNFDEICNSWKMDKRFEAIISIQVAELYKKGWKSAVNGVLNLKQ